MSSTYIWTRWWPIFYHSQWFPDSHFWTKVARVLLIDKMMHPMKWFLGIVHQPHWPIFDLGYDLYSIIYSGFQTLFPEQKQLGSCYLAQWCILWRPCLELLANLTYIWPRLWCIFYHYILFHTVIPEWKAARIMLIGTMMHPINVLLGIVHQPHWPIFDLGYDLYSITHISFRTLISEQRQLGYCYLAQ